MRRRAILALVLVVVGSYLSCSLWKKAPVPQAPSSAKVAPPSEGAPIQTDLVAVDAGTLGELADDLSAASLAAAIDRDLEYLARQRDDWLLALSESVCPASSLRLALEGLREALDDGTPLDRYVREHFRIFRSVGRNGGSFFTGYYEPVIEGRRLRGGPFVHALYRRPPDLVEIPLGSFDAKLVDSKIYGRLDHGRLEPYYSRREIDGARVLDGRGLELVWLADPVDRYFLHVQGSGVIRFEDGSHLRVGFAGSNGRPYTSIGQLLIADGSLGPGEASSPAIQRYLRAHPERRDRILFSNDRYVFFREAEDGPVGSLGVRLTAGRSIATDPSNYPPGALAYIRTRVPVVENGSDVARTQPIQRFVLNQDAGAAITGPGRVDLFFGTADQAGLDAGNMSATGEIYWLMPDCATR
jgi:membrane-bound lytic murein transglycosylase A